MQFSHRPGGFFCFIFLFLFFFFFGTCDMMFAFSLEAQHHNYDVKMLLIIWVWRVFTFYVWDHTVLLPHSASPSWRRKHLRETFSIPTSLQVTYASRQTMSSSWKRLLTAISLTPLSISSGVSVPPLISLYNKIASGRLLRSPSSTLSTLCIEDNN